MKIIELSVMTVLFDSTTTVVVPGAVLIISGDFAITVLVAGKITGEAEM